MPTQDRLPTGNGFNNTWSASSGGSKWLDVDDPIGSPDGDATYCFRQNSAGSQLWTFTAFSVPSATSINSVSVLQNARAVAGTTADVDARLRVNGSIYDSADRALSTSYANYTEVWLTNPDTGAAWTKADIEGTGSNPLQEFGGRLLNLGAGEEARVSATFARVDFAEAAAARAPAAALIAARPMAPQLLA